ncbi:NAD-dependent epimerase/dehydratase family protein [Rhodopila sp.]|uniref:NAD-dependent epimerase/dehydratase family protein n=1 Tax=Rhodopila sp. TaxID=2480087 RepID=UPI003D09E013
MRIAITGGSGRLGRHVLRALSGHALRVLDLVAPFNQGVDFRRADLRELDVLIAAMQGIEVVVHLGGIDRSVATDDAVTMQVNSVGTWNVFEASRLAGVRRVIHCSSSAVTGIDHSNPTMPPDYLPIDEAHVSRPTDAYGLSKLCGEQIAEAYARRGLEVLVLRPCFIAFATLAGFMCGESRPADRDEPMPYLRAYVGPEDCARGFAAAVNLVNYTGFDRFFLAAADTFANAPTVARLEALYSRWIPLREPALYTDFPQASPVSHAQARLRLGWTPTTRWSGTGIEMAPAGTDRLMG